MDTQQPVQYSVLHWRNEYKKGQRQALTLAIQNTPEASLTC
ncbi:hypothetical protein AB4574_06885 [Vibrio sp. 10N.222.49.E5]